jgi:radical SAM protein with 4Fe4S-binding SPASM domain
VRLGCPEPTSYGDFTRALHAKLGGKRWPASGTFEMTWRCNLACAHCYNNLPAGDRAARRAELTREEHCRILDEVAEAGCLWLLYTGGEIFARPDFLDIYTHAKRKGFLITLFTNGKAVTPRIADFLAEWRPFKVEITLYGRTRETYERFTGDPGSFDRCMRGIRLLLDRDLPLSLKTVVTNINRHELAAMRRFVETDLGVDFRFDGMVNARLDGAPGPAALRLTAEEIVALDLADPTRRDEWAKAPANSRPPAGASGGAGPLYSCGAGVHGFSVDPYGTLRICALSMRDGYDLRSGSFREGWEQAIDRIRSKPATRWTKCTACTLQALCGMCPAMGELEHGDPERAVEPFCEVGHLRAIVLGVPLPAHGPCEFCPGGPLHEALLAKAERLLGAVARVERQTPAVAIRSDA